MKHTSFSTEFDLAELVNLPRLKTTFVRALGLDLVGVRPSGRSHAIHHRYLARRALRLGGARTLALRHAVSVSLTAQPGSFHRSGAGPLR